MAGRSQVNGAEAFSIHWVVPTVDADKVRNITDALHATLDPRTSNDVRGQAREFLEGIKDRFDGPHCGFILADDFNQNDAVRYFGLQVLEHAVRWKWNDYARKQTEQVEQWIKCLAGSVRPNERTFIRNKIAQLWAEVAKRTWGEEWMDMDQMLVTLWEKPREEKGFAAKLLVLTVLETLSEDIFNNDDCPAGLRRSVLGDAMNDVMLPPSLYREFEQNRGERCQVRSGEEGWLSRLCAFFATCLKEMKISNDGEYLDELSTCAVSALQALRPTMQWINLKATVEVNLVGCLNLAFHMYNVPLQTAAAELLYNLLSRPHAPHATPEAWKTTIQQALLPDTIASVRSRFESIQVVPGEDDERYLLQKKLAEMISVMADLIGEHPELPLDNTDMDAFFQLLLSVLQHQSLMVSIPVLHSWPKLLGAAAMEKSKVSEYVFQGLGVVLQTCSARMLRYESMSEADGERDATVQFLYDDFDTMPERHAFLGNYRRFCVDVIQMVARARPVEALEHVLGQMQNMLETGPYTFGRGFESANYSRSSMPCLQFDAQFQIVTTALKGYEAWIRDVEALQPEDEMRAKGENDRGETDTKLQQWAYGIINIHVDDPEVAALVLTTLVTIIRTTKTETTFVLHVVQHLLTMQLNDNPAHEYYSDAVKAFENLRVTELQRLAMTHPDELLEVYQELEPRINVVAQKHSKEPRLFWGYRSFLLIIVHRASGIAQDVRMGRLQEMVKPVYEAWSDPGLTNSLSDLHTFCQSQGLGQLDEFYRAYRFADVADWSTQQLDQAGQARQSAIKAKVDESPMRMTKTLLAASTERSKYEDESHEIACALWAPLIPVVLPPLLRMLQHAQAFHNMANWSHLAPELQAVFKRTMQDRFWQSGISNESKEEFYARISGSKTSYEGFASAVRGTMRNVREQGLHIIFLFSKFDEQFFGFADLAQPLADALWGDAESLSANHLHPAINLMNGLVQRCPRQYRATFLPPLLNRMFITLNAKITHEWAAIDDNGQINSDELGDEMRTESVLRQLTYSTISFVPILLDTLGKVLGDPAVIEPVLVFCTRALRLRDTRCVSTATKVFRRLTKPALFGGGNPAEQAARCPPAVRDYFATDVLRAGISSLHESYFADVQRDLAGLIANLVAVFAPTTSAVREVLCSLPQMDPQRVDKAITKILAAAAKGVQTSERTQRSVVLDLLAGLRGVSIYEAGKMAREPPKGPKKGKEKYLGDMEVQQAPRVVEGEEQGLDGVAGMFGG